MFVFACKQIITKGPEFVDLQIKSVDNLCNGQKLNVKGLINTIDPKEQF